MHIPQISRRQLRHYSGVRDTSFTFGVTGILRNSALVLYDRSAFSLWTQEGIAIWGPLKGVRLRRLDSLRTTWALWRRQYPRTLVMQPPAAPNLESREPGNR